MRKIDTSLETALTKPTKAPFVSSVSSISKESPNISPWLRRAKELAALAATKPAEARSVDTPGEIPSPADAENLLERYTERAAIQEHDGGLPHRKAEEQARRAVFQGRHAYHFKLAAFPDESPVYLSTTARGATEARRELEARFGAGRVLGCWPAGEPRPAVPPVSGQEGGR